MGEVINVVVAFAVIVFIFRWLTTSKCHNSVFPLLLTVLQVMTLPRSAAQQIHLVLGPSLFLKIWYHTLATRTPDSDQSFA